MLKKLIASRIEEQGSLLFIVVLGFDELVNHTQGFDITTRNQVRYEHSGYICEDRNIELRSSKYIVPLIAVDALN